MKHRLLYNQRSRPLVVRRENAGFETLLAPVQLKHDPACVADRSLTYLECLQVKCNFLLFLFCIQIYEQRVTLISEYNCINGYYIGSAFQFNVTHVKAASSCIVYCFHTQTHTH